MLNSQLLNHTSYPTQPPCPPLPPLSPPPPQSLGRHCLLLDSFIRSRWKPVGRVLTTDWNVTVRVCVSVREREERGETNKRERERERERKHVYANEGAYQGLPPLAHLHMQTYICLFSCHGRCVVSMFFIFIYINKYSRARTEACFFFSVPRYCVPSRKKRCSFFVCHTFVARGSRLPA